MNMTWDLEILYKGYDDPKYLSDCQKVEKLIKEINEHSLTLNEKNALECIEKELKLEEQLQILLEELFTYSSLRSSTNVNDFEALSEMGKLQMALQETVSASVKFTKFLNYRIK